MPGSFVAQSTMSNAYGPEGIYLSAPVEGDCRIVQGWGENPEFHSQYTYAGVHLKGHIGIDLATEPGSNVLATDAGRVTELSIEPGGFGRYIKLEHRWGESLYAQLGDILVESGQTVARGQIMAHTEASRRPYTPHLHFAIRILPFNRFDGWGGYSDPLPYLYVGDVETVAEDAGAEENTDPTLIPPLAKERPGMRRP
jgi:murein DD-endopeptidase MepM/ murein hydrolase activator NlpD